jgi:hypothetical protein
MHACMIACLVVVESSVTSQCIVCMLFGFVWICCGFAVTGFLDFYFRVILFSFYLSLPLHTTHTAHRWLLVDGFVVASTIDIGTSCWCWLYNVVSTCCATGCCGWIDEQHHWNDNDNDNNEWAADANLSLPLILGQEEGSSSSNSNHTTTTTTTAQRATSIKWQ